MCTCVARVWLVGSGFFPPGFGKQDLRHLQWESFRCQEILRVFDLKRLAVSYFHNGTSTCYDFLVVKTLEGKAFLGVG